MTNIVYLQAQMIKQNGQTHSNNSSAKVVGLALKGLRSTKDN